jgi:hypothetical protein
MRPGSRGSVPTYVWAQPEGWPSIEEAKAIVEANKLAVQREDFRPGSRPQAHRSRRIVILVSGLLLVPPLAYALVKLVILSVGRVGRRAMTSKE